MNQSKDKHYEMPVFISLWQPSTPYAWTNMPAALTEFSGTTRLRFKYNLTSASQARIIVRIETAPFANAKIKAQYSLDETTWLDLCSVTMPATGAKTNIGNWTDIPAKAQDDVFIRLAGQDGDGVADPTFTTICLQVR